MNTEDYNECVQKHSDGVYRYALKNLKDEDEARDIVQSAFEKLWIKRDRVKVETMKSYLFTIAHNAIVDRWRQTNKLSDMDEKQESKQYARPEEYRGLKEIIERALNTLPDIQKNVIMLRDYEGYSYEEIGEITSLNPSQVKVYIFRGRKTLQKYLGSLEAVL
jgi:RNA polymerase sigma-70 factor (ECF subfamily)